MKDDPTSSRESDPARRPIDAIVAGAARSGLFGPARLRSTWVMLGRGDEPMHEFFLDSPFGAEGSPAGEDPKTWICRGLRTDGTLRLGALDFEIDRFASQILFQEDSRPESFGR